MNTQTAGLRTWLLIALGLLLFVQAVLSIRDSRTLSYSEFLDAVERGQVESAEISEATIHATIRHENATTREINVKRVPGIDERQLVDALRRHGAKIVGSGPSTLSAWLSWLAIAVLPIVIIIGLSAWSARFGGGRAGALSFGRSKAKVYDASKADVVTFADVAGVDEAKEELLEVVDFLKNPQRFRTIGARIPKGVLLLGAPGTGKTLLARAVAGEAQVPFFSMSGSEFVEMFVGVGAARVRDLFVQAKQRAPCIVFIDEIDAVGRSRGALGVMATHDEREQTLNQLLAEMDGFDAQSGVVIMAATNRPEILDPALVRSGRFDRQVVVDRPDMKGRLAILLVHVRHLQLANNVDLEIVARRTPAMVGADLAKVANEAALAAARRHATQVEQKDFEEAIDRIQLGLKKHGRAMSETEKRRVAFHEAGHALVALFVEHADPVHRVTIIPRSIGTLGATLQLPTEERHLLTRPELGDRLCVMLAGHVAEQLVFGEPSTGARDDLERATETARQMVCEFGMSERLGPQSFGRRPSYRYLDVLGGDEQRNFSEQTAQTIDAEIKLLLASADERARAILTNQRNALTAVAEALIQEETLDRRKLEEIVVSVTHGTKTWLGNNSPRTLLFESKKIEPKPGSKNKNARLEPKI